MITLLVMTDGRRECIERTIPSALELLSGPISRKLIHDDSGDVAYRDWLASTFPDFTVIGFGDRVGFGGAIQRAWSKIDDTPGHFVFHLEDDFLLRRPVSLEAMAAALQHDDDLVQLALLRQPVNSDEIAAGGIMQQDSDAFERREWGKLAWHEHRKFFTTNPSLYRASLCRRPWPGGRHSEGRFGWDLFAEDGSAKAAFWGDGEWVEHIGQTRVGTGY